MKSPFKAAALPAPLFCEYVAVDLETTGLLVESDRVVEIGAVRFDREGRELGRFEKLVNPGRPMSVTARAVNGISDADLADAPPIRAVLSDFIAFLGDPATSTLLAHNSWFDAAFLGMELAREGEPPPSHGVVDTLALARRKRPDFPNHRLDALAEAFGLPDVGRHRALADSLRVMGLWVALGGSAEPIEGLTAYRVRDVRLVDSPPVGWDGIAEAIERGQKLKMEYLGGTRGAAPREITPRKFTNRGGVAYLVALCHLDDSEKNFRLDRVNQWEVV